MRLTASMGIACKSVSTLKLLMINGGLKW